MTGVQTCALPILARARRIAFSEEMVRANLQEVERRLGALGLPQVGLQLEALGFDTRPLKARPWDLARLEPPALIDLDGHFVLVLATGRGGGVLVGDPRSGLKRLSLQRLEELAGDGLAVLVVREGRTSPSTEGFGFGWFVPALLRYPWLLTLTLVTSFTVQLLQVVEPLGLMLMFDAVLGRNNPSLLWPVTTVLVMAVLLGLLLWGLLRSPWGKAFTALRDNPIRAESLGIDTRGYTLLSFAIGAAYAGIAGGLYASQVQFIDPALFKIGRAHV